MVAQVDLAAASAEAGVAVDSAVAAPAEVEPAEVGNQKSIVDKIVAKYFS